MVSLTMSQFLASSNNSRKKPTDNDSSASPPVFQSNLACVLNDPKKTRAEIASFFTKTWGSSFVDRPPDPLTRLGDHTLSDFENYFASLRKSDKYGRPRVGQQFAAESAPPEKTNPIINIPQLFFSSQFSLGDASTFNLVFPGMIPTGRPLSPTNSEHHKSRTTSTSSDKSEDTRRRQSTSSSSNNPKSTANGTVTTTTNSSPKHSISSSARFLQDKYSHYLDEVELSISRALATKSHCFHDAVRSHDEIQSFLHTTRHAISSLRQQLSNYDSQSLLTLLRLSRLLRQRQNQRELLKRLESLSIVKQTHLQVQSLLSTSDYLSALDLIDQTREIIASQLNDLSSLRFYDAQLQELYQLNINLMRQDFGQTLAQQLSNSTETSADDGEEDKFITILIGLIRVRDEKYIEEIRSKFESFVFNVIDQTAAANGKDIPSEKINRTISKNSSDSSMATDEPSSSSSNIRYIYPSSINSSSSSFPVWCRSMTDLFQSAEQALRRLSLVNQLICESLSKHQQVLPPSLLSLLPQLFDTVEDRLLAVLTAESTRCQVHFERLSLDEYAQMVKLIETFIQHVNAYEKKYPSRPLKTFLQSQTSKFLNHFHEERKQRVADALDNEQWKQVAVPRSIQNSVDELFASPKPSPANGSDTLIIDGEHFVLTNSALHLFMPVLDYYSCAQMLPASSINDVQHRLLELLNVFNSKTCQLVLGAGAVQLGKIRTISAKILAITCRCLQFIKVTVPKIKARFDQLQASTTISSISSNKQFEQLTKLYSEHIDEIHGKLISIIERTFGDTLATYEVRAPMPSDCFRTLVTRHIAAFYNAVARIVSPADLVLLFTRLNSIFKQLLGNRLRQLRIANDGGPQHGLLTSDLLYYIKQVQNLPGLEMLELHVDEIWNNN